MIEYRTLKSDLLKSDKILVIRMREYEGKMYPWHYWVKRNEKEAGDIVLHDPKYNKYYCCKDEEDVQSFFKLSFNKFMMRSEPEERQSLIAYNLKIYFEA